MSKRLQNNIYLIGYLPEVIGVNKLPSNREALGFFMKLHNDEKETIRTASTNVIRQIQEIWRGKARIPTKPEQHSIQKLEKLFSKWKDLKKLRNRSTQGEENKRNSFKQSLDDLFDISHSDAMKIIKLQEDRDFLIAQREKGRRGTFGPVDTALAAKEDRVEKRRNKQKRLKIKSVDEHEASTSKVVLTSSSGTESQMDSQDSEEEIVFRRTNKQCKFPKVRGTKKIVTPSLAAVLDRTNVSDRKATMLIMEAVKSAGENPAIYNINRASIRRDRIKVRENFAKNLHMKLLGDSPLTVHWDGKLMEDLTSKKSVDRLAILVSGQDVSQLLGVPSIPSGTGISQANAVVDALNQWGISNRIVSLSFDTTASNTGIHGGSCVLIEELLARNLLYFPCRHHILELILGAAFKSCMPASSSGPEAQLFKKFQSDWPNIDKSVYESGITDATIRSNILSEKERIIEFTLNQLLTHQPRDDYRELLELTMIFLGENPPHGLCFRTPGPIHHARWMSKAIYCLKVWLFRSQFNLTTKEEKGLRAMCMFISLIYVEHWFTAPCAIQAPRRDLNLIKKLQQFQKLNSKISEATSEKLQRHLWYLSEENVVLALFDDEVSLPTKRAILLTMKATECDKQQGKVQKRCIQNINHIKENNLEWFASPISMNLLQNMRISTSFLDVDPSRWNDDLAFQAAKKEMNVIRVVNDHAERGIALIQQYNKSLTKDEEQLQYLLQVVAEHRRNFPDARKNLLLQDITESPSFD